MKVLKGILLVLTAVLILLPSAVSLSHIFSGHGHELCDNYSAKHFHSDNIDCELYKFHKKPIVFVPLFEISALEIEQTLKANYNHYEFLNDYQALPFDLRGPPSFLLV